MSKSINVRTPSGDYEVLIGSKLLGSYNFKWLVQNRQILIIKDSMVPNEILETLRISLSNSQPMEIKVLEIETNEKTKSFEGLIPIFEVLNANKFNNIFAVDGGAALHIKNEAIYKSIVFKKNKSAYLVCKDKGEIIEKSYRKIILI